MNNSATDSDSDLRFAIQPYHPRYDVVPNHTAAATSAQLVPLSATTNNNNKNSDNPRKKRTKVTRPDSNPKSPSRIGGASAKREKRPEITMPCSECGKRFWSWKALFGHMRCHPERQWRGINPPPNLRRGGGCGGVSISPPPIVSVSDDESDVAACLLLLANAGGPRPSESDSDRFECSSCKKVFGSHQALGGHRASHKNVKGCFAMAAAAEDQNVDVSDESDRKMIVAAATTEQLVFGFSSETPQHHQCGICLRIFPSGQALGGHKRCHWEKGGFDDVVQPLSVVSSASQALDLNLPPRMEEEEEDRDHQCNNYYSSTSNSSASMALDLRLGL